mmetsp:Transcript_37406/g.67281  ORF Transcript_37406/g.67281 Transcript_37406/m.67281 type:complete len:361 (-) Transcript_37406:81-1163(-)
MVMRLDPRSSSPSPMILSSSLSSPSSSPISLFFSILLIFFSSSIPATSNAFCNSFSKSFVASNFSTSVSLVTRLVVAPPLLVRKSSVSASRCSCTASIQRVTSVVVAAVWTLREARSEITRDTGMAVVSSFFCVTVPDLEELVSPPLERACIDFWTEAKFAVSAMPPMRESNVSFPSLALDIADKAPVWYSLSGKRTAASEATLSSDILPPSPLLSDFFPDLPDDLLGVTCLSRLLSRLSMYSPPSSSSPSESEEDPAQSFSLPLSLLPSSPSALSSLSSPLSLSSPMSFPSLLPPFFPPFDFLDLVNKSPYINSSSELNASSSSISSSSLSSTRSTILGSLDRAMLMILVDVGDCVDYG